jgi:hypothetical protein
MKKIVFILAASLWGCAPLIPVVKMSDISKEERHQLASVGIYTQTQLIGKKYALSKYIVEGNSCKNKLWDPAATKSDAIHQTHYHAMKMGADGITSLHCEDPRRGTAQSTNCWESITCTATAIKFDD